MEKPTPQSIEQKYQHEAIRHRDKLIEVGWSVEKANRLARAKYLHAVFNDDISRIRPDPDFCGPQDRP